MEVLYRFFDKDAQLLYVGISNNWTQRLKQHYKHSRFFEQVRYATFTHYETREQVEQAELLAIKSEGAIYNKAFNPNYETSITHFRKIKDWVYSTDEPDEQHAGIVNELRILFLNDDDWEEKKSGPIAFYLIEFMDEWQELYQLDCNSCVDLYNDTRLSLWSENFAERKYNAAD